MNGRHPDARDGRWVDQTGSGDRVEERIGALLQRVSAPQPLPRAALERVQARLKRRAQRPGRLDARPLRWAVVAAVLVSGSGVVFARKDVRRWIQDTWTGPSPSSPETLREPERRSRKPRRRAPAPRLEPASTFDAPALTPAAPAELASAIDSLDPAPIALPRIARTIARSAATASAPPSLTASLPSKMAAEASLLWDALERLRHLNDPAAALVLLDRYEREHGQGAMHGDAALVRLDALLMLNRRSQALSLIESLATETGSLSEELALLRAELWAEKDCGRALERFEPLLAGTLPPHLAERALYGRAGCRVRSDDLSGAEQDFRSYLRQFPRGRFASRVRDALSRATPE